MNIELTDMKHKQDEEVFDSQNNTKLINIQKMKRAAA